MTAVDFRLTTLSLSINGQLKTFSSPMGMTCKGKRTANQHEAKTEITIANLSKSDQDYLVTATSPYNKNPEPKLAIFSAGRVSTGTNIIFQGNITKTKVSQPPDRILTFTCLAHQYVKGKIVQSQQSATALASVIAAQIAQDCGLTVNFQATDKQISNYSFTGAALKQVAKLNTYGYSAWVDGTTMYVTNLNTPAKGNLRVLDIDSGLVGVPEPTEQGVRLVYMLDNTSKAGGALQLISKVYPTLNGIYRIFDLGWDITSRQIPFYWIADCKRVSA